MSGERKLETLSELCHSFHWAKRVDHAAELDLDRIDSSHFIAGLPFLRAGFHSGDWSLEKQATVSRPTYLRALWTGGSILKPRILHEHHDWATMRNVSRDGYLRL